MINTINIDDRAPNRQLWVSFTTYHIKTPTQLFKPTQKLIFVLIFRSYWWLRYSKVLFVIRERFSYELPTSGYMNNPALKFEVNLTAYGHPKSHGWSNPSFHSHSTKPYTIRRHFDHLSSSSMNIIQIYYCQCPWLVKFDHFIEI